MYLVYTCFLGFKLAAMHYYLGFIMHAHVYLQFFSALALMDHIKVWVILIFSSFEVLHILCPWVFVNEVEQKECTNGSWFCFTTCYAYE